MNFPVAQNFPRAPPKSAAPGCYIDTLNPIPPSSRVLVRITHHDETFEAEAQVVYVGYGLGMGMAFITCEGDQMARLDRRLAEASYQQQTV